MKIAPLATLCFTCLLGILPAAASAQPYVISTDGSEVTDQKTGLIWRRCVEGMSWDNAAIPTPTCVGTSSVFSHEAALTRAKSQAATTGIAWRLPNIQELASIVDSSTVNPALDATAFPATAASYFWSASPSVGNSSSAWFVNFYDGYVGSSLRGLTYYVRLVRAGQ
jgi:hypothetical protein